LRQQSLERGAHRGRSESRRPGSRLHESLEWAHSTLPSLLFGEAECKPVEVPAPGAEPCIADEALFALATGSLPESQLPSAEAHLRHCEDCRSVLAEVARGRDSLSQDLGAASAGHPRGI
jgi:hypothetical protein